MGYYPAGYAKGITNSKTVTEVGEYVLDATQNNPAIPGSLRQGINIATEKLDALAMIKEFYTVRSFENDNKNGYMKIATIKILHGYTNIPITFEVSGRGWGMPAQLYIMFSNSLLNNVSIGSFKYTGNIQTDVALCQLDTQTWGLYVSKTELYDRICIHRWNYNYIYQKIDVSFSNEIIESLPANAVHPTLYQ